MSLLTPTQVDWMDAHEEKGQESVYRSKINQLRSELGPDGESKFPWTFEVVPGFFKQSDDATDDLKFHYGQEDLGKLKKWDQIIEDLNTLNKNAGPNESYKLLICSRHGQGFHNVVVDKYGYDEWVRYWHKQTHDGDIEFGPDAMLTERGINQAKENQQIWANELEKGAPIPQKFYVSPMRRSSHTVVYTWYDLIEDKSSFVPIVTENLRETYGVNCCDKRSTKTVINERFGKYGFRFEPGFTEEDELFTDTREELSHHAVRINTFLQQLFEGDYDKEKSKVDKSKALGNTFISTTSHAGSIRCFIMVLGHRHFTISTGGMIPIVVKATRNS